MTRGAIGKGLALCSSILLAGCFVAYRQNQARQPDAPAVLPGSKNPASGKLVRWQEPGKQDAVKSGEVSDFVSPQAGASERSTGKKTVFPSSKSIDSILRPSDLPDQPINRNSIDAILNQRNGEPINGTDLDGIPDEPRKPAKDP